uniref:Uncharacterized protein n=1 Tax=uncultured bacterium contig00074 TaxID=1181553 RepID=A0A806KG63_9BACT|nr:hypothetical protein [uncultured bacterium contig00074]
MDFRREIWIHFEGFNVEKRIIRFWNLEVFWLATVNEADNHSRL